MADLIYKTPFTAEALVALEKALIQGVSTVKYADKEVTYRSLAEMSQIRAMIRAELGLDQVNGAGSGFFGGRKKIGRHTKGLAD